MFQLLATETAVVCFAHVQEKNRFLLCVVKACVGEQCRVRGVACILFSSMRASWQSWDHCGDLRSSSSLTVASALYSASLVLDSFTPPRSLLLPRPLLLPSVHRFLTRSPRRHASPRVAMELHRPRIRHMQQRRVSVSSHSLTHSTQRQGQQTAGQGADVESFMCVCVCVAAAAALSLSLCRSLLQREKQRDVRRV